MARYQFLPTDEDGRIVDVRHIDASLWFAEVKRLEHESLGTQCVLDNIAANLEGDLSGLSREQLLHKLQVVKRLAG